MLFKETLSPSSYEILQKLCSIEELNDFELVGGTSLALQIGHRISIDLDFFCVNMFDTRKIKQVLLDNFHKNSITFDYEEKNTLIGSIDQIKIDFIRHAYPKIDDTLIIDGIRLSSVKDIAAMKIGAITDNGTRIKDFVDLYYLLKQFKMQEVIGFFEQKYQSENLFSALKSIVYFNDLDPDSIKYINYMNNKQLSFENLKSFITKETENYINSQIKF